MADSKKEITFNKNQLVNSKKYVDKVDLLNVILEDGKNYTAKEVDKLINEFMKKEVK